MAYDEALAARVRAALKAKRSISEKAMFGGLCFLTSGKMFAGISHDELMVRVGPEKTAEALARPHARPMDFTGRPLKGFVYVGAPGCKTTAAVRAWLERGLAYATALPAQPRRPAAKRRRAIGPR